MADAVRSAFRNRALEEHDVTRLCLLFADRSASCDLGHRAVTQVHAHLLVAVCRESTTVTFSVRDRLPSPAVGQFALKASSEVDNVLTCGF